MSFILNEDTTNVPTFITLPSGTEVQLRILGAEMKNAKSSGAPMLAVSLDIPSEPYSKNIYHNIMLPSAQDDEKRRAQKLNRLKDFKEAFGLPQSGPIHSEDMEGAMGWAILNEETGLNDELQNTIKKFIVGA